MYDTRILDDSWDGIQTLAVDAALPLLALEIYPRNICGVLTQFSQGFVGRARGSLPQIIRNLTEEVEGYVVAYQE